MGDPSPTACQAEIAANLGPGVYAKWRQSELGAITERLEDKALFAFIRLVIGELGRWSFWALQRYLRGKFGSRLWRMGHSWTATQLCGFAAGAGLAVTGIRGAIYFPRSTVAARLLAPLEGVFSRITTIGAAFVAMTATKGKRRDE